MKTEKALLIFFLILSFSLSFVQIAGAQAPPPACSGDFKPLFNNSSVCVPANTGLPETSVADIFANVLFWIMGIFGMLAILAFIISGIQYLVSAGEEKTLETAKRNMKWSLVGVVIGLSGMVIIKAITAALQATLK